MIIVSLITALRTRIEKRREFDRLVSEIMSLTERDLVDMRGSRDEMLRHARNQVYGGGIVADQRFGI